MPEGSLDLCGGEPDSTNNRMELAAAIRALEHFPEGTQIEMRCDSRYVIDSITKWIPGWKAKGWRTTTGPVKNLDLVQRLDELASQRGMKWTWVRGHAGNALNERADRLVARGRREACSRPRQPNSASVPAAATPTATMPAPTGAAAARRTASVPIDLALGLDISSAAERAGTTAPAFVELGLGLLLFGGHRERFCARCFSDAEDPSSLRP